MSKKIFFPTLLLSLFLASALLAKTIDKIFPFLGNNEIDISHYQIELSVPELPPRQLDFVTTIELSPLTNIESVELHIESQVMNIQKVSLDGTELRYNILPGISNQYGLSGSVLEVLLPKTYAAGESLKLKLTYSVSKQNWTKDDMGLFYVPPENNHGQNILITRNWPYYGRYWLPSNDAPQDVATVEFKIKVPDQYRVAANGALTHGDEVQGSGLQPDGLRLFEWKQDTATTVYNFAFAIGKFDIFKKDICFNNDGALNDLDVPCETATNRIPTVLYYNQGDPSANSLLAQIHKAHSSVIYFSKLFGRYSFEKVGFIHSPYPFAMESTSMIVLNSPSAAVHEIVHHWWGNNVHIDHWGDFWISEGFTTYFTGVFDEYKIGKNTSCLRNNPEDLNHKPETDPNSIFNDTPYCKGAFALHDLRERIIVLGGSSPGSARVFFDLIRSLYTSHAGHRLSTTMFVAYVQANLKQVLEANQVPVTDEAIVDLVRAWSAAWFVETAKK